MKRRLSRLGLIILLFAALIGRWLIFIIVLIQQLSILFGRRGLMLLPVDQEIKEPDERGWIPISIKPVEYERYFVCEKDLRNQCYRIFTGYYILQSDGRIDWTDVENPDWTTGCDANHFSEEEQLQILCYAPYIRPLPPVCIDKPGISIGYKG
jgi:hypothetical protein